MVVMDADGSYLDTEVMSPFDHQELLSRVDEVLFYIWDPIGVSHEPCARREYRSYAPKVLELVEQSEKTDPISAHLRDIVENRMGLQPNKRQCDETAQLLLMHKEAIEAGEV